MSVLAISTPVTVTKEEAVETAETVETAGAAKAGEDGKIGEYLKTNLA